MRRAGNILLAVMVAAGILSLWWGRRESPRPPVDPGRSGSAALALPLQKEPLAGSRQGEQPAPIHLAVLNGTTQPRLAQQVGLGVALVGCVTERVGNAPHDRFARTLLINRRLSAARARELAERLGGLEIILEREPRATEDAVLVLGADCARVLGSLGLSAELEPDRVR
jgi:hypothetical protein